MDLAGLEQVLTESVLPAARGNRGVAFGLPVSGRVARGWAHFRMIDPARCDYEQHVVRLTICTDPHESEEQWLNVHSAFQPAWDTPRPPWGAVAIDFFEDVIPADFSLPLWVTPWAKLVTWAVLHDKRPLLAARSAGLDIEDGYV